jgi:hypothetical protein
MNNHGQLEPEDFIISQEDYAKFIELWHRIAIRIHLTNCQKGFWPPNPEDRNKSEAIMLVVTELAEGVEGIRHGNPPDDKVPEFDSASAEMADAIIRLMDMGKGFGWRIPEALVAKQNYNVTRAHKHGKLF